MHEVRNVDRQRYLEALARMSPSDRVAKAFELSAMTTEMLRAAVRRRFPEKDEAEVHEIFLARLRRCSNRND